MYKMTFFAIAIVFSAIMLNAVPRDYVVVEVVTGTWCQYCPGAALGVDEMIDNDLRAAIVEYHGNDTFENAASGNRISYYGVSNYPTAFFDGLNSVAGGDHTESMYSYYLPRYNNRINVNSAFSISLDGHLEGSIYTVTATVNKVETSTATNLYLRAALTESDISFNWQGQTHLNFVERAMYPNATGTAISFTGSNTQTVTYTFSINSDWVRNNCELVVFLQNNTTKEILQGTKAKIAGLVNAYPLNMAEINYGDVVVNTSSTAELVLNNYWNQNMVGTIECTNPNVNINYPGRDAFDIPPFGQEIYWITCFPNEVGPFTGDIIINTNIAAYPIITIPLTANSFYDNPPSVTDVHVNGIPVVYQVLTGNYTFNDADGDTESNSVYQWYRMESGVYVTAIDNQTGITYTVQPADIGKQIIFGVAPHDEHGIGSATVMSPATEVIEALPVPQNLAAQVSNNQDVVLTWQAPNHFGRGLFGYRIYRNGATLTTVSNPSTLAYTDHNLSNGTYSYYVVAVYNNPLSFSVASNTVVAEITQSTGSHDNTLPVLVTKLYTAYPNPFQANTTIRYSLGDKSDMDISIYDIRGRKIRSFTKGTKEAGEYQVMWNGKDENGTHLPSGVYQCCLTVGNYRETVKLVLVK